jgi:hypothetical protein
MATVRRTLNRILVTLGEATVDDSVTDLADTYQLQVLEFLNQFKEEIEAAHNWRSLRAIKTVTILAAASSGTISSVNERARVLRDPNTLTPLVHDVTTASNPIPLREMDLAELLWRLQAYPDDTSTSPTHFAIASDGNDVMTLHVWPRVSTQRSIKLQLVVPQDYLEADDLDTGVLVPERALLQGTIWFALKERGEELGQGSMFTEERYRVALSDEVALDATEGGALEMVVV